jgi:hypothetical protein
LTPPASQGPAARKRTVALFCCSLAPAHAGLPVLEERGFDPFNDVRREYFFTSPAWDALRHWVTSHLRLAKAHAACDPYLRRWYDWAIVEAKALAL